MTFNEVSYFDLLHNFVEVHGSESLDYTKEGISSEVYSVRPFDS